MNSLVASMAAHTNHTLFSKATVLVFSLLYIYAAGPFSNPPRRPRYAFIIHMVDKVMKVSTSEFTRQLSPWT